MLIKMTLRFRLIPVRLARIKKTHTQVAADAGENVEEKKTSPLLVGVQSCIAALKSNMAFSQKMGLNLPQDTAILFWGTYPKNVISNHKDACSAVS